MKTILQLVVILAAVLLAVNPVAAVQRSPDVAEINWFYFDECTNYFWWQSSTEINIPGYRIEHPASGWTGDYINALNYGTIYGLTYHLPGPAHADLAGDYMLRVYFDNGTSRMEDIAIRVCNWTPGEVTR